MAGKLHELLLRVREEELSDDALVEMLGQVARGESVKKTYRVADQPGGQKIRLQVGETVTTTPADQIRGLMFINRLGDLGMDLNGKEGTQKIEQGEAMKLFTPAEDEGFDEIIYRRETRRRVVAPLPQAREGTRGSSDEEG